MLHPKVAESIETLGVTAETMACAPELADTAVFCAHYGVDPADSANTILVSSRRPEGRIAACVVLSTTRLDVNRAVRDLLGVKKLSFSKAEETEAVTGMHLGGVTPFGLAPGIPVYIDAQVMTRARVVLGGGNRSSKLRMAPSELLRIPDVTVVDGLAT